MAKMRSTAARKYVNDHIPEPLQIKALSRSLFSFHGISPFYSRTAVFSQSLLKRTTANRFAQTVLLLAAILLYHTLQRLGQLKKRLKAGLGILKTRPVIYPDGPSRPGAERRMNPPFAWKCSGAAEPSPSIEMSKGGAALQAAEPKTKDTCFQQMSFVLELLM